MRRSAILPRSIRSFDPKLAMSFCTTFRRALSLAILCLLATTQVASGDFEQEIGGFYQIGYPRGLAAGTEDRFYFGLANKRQTRTTLKASNSVQFLWKKGTGRNQLQSVAVSPDGETVIAAGHDRSQEMVWVGTYAADSGRVGWSRTYDFGLDTFVEINVVAAADGESIFVGGGGFRNDRFDAFLARLDLEGEEIWSRVVDTGEDNLIRGIAADSRRGGVFFTGETGGVEGPPYKDLVFGRYDADGDQDFVERIDGPAGEYDRGYELVVSNNGKRVYVVGDSSHPSGGGVFLLRFTHKGKLNWRRVIETDSERSYGYSLALSANQKMIHVVGQACPDSFVCNALRLTTNGRGKNPVWVERNRIDYTQDDAEQGIVRMPDGIYRVIGGIPNTFWVLAYKD